MSIFENLLLTGNEERFIKIWNKKLKKRIVCDSSFNYQLIQKSFYGIFKKDQVEEIGFF